MAVYRNTAVMSSESEQLTQVAYSMTHGYDFYINY